MKMSEHIKRCQALVKEYGDKECYYTHDKVGSCYSPLQYAPDLWFGSNQELDDGTGILSDVYEVEEVYSKGAEDMFELIYVIN